MLYNGDKSILYCVWHYEEAFSLFFITVILKCVKIKTSDSCSKIKVVVFYSCWIICSKKKKCLYLHSEMSDCKILCENV